MLKKFDLTTSTVTSREFPVQVIDIQGYLDSSTFQELQNCLQTMINNGEKRIIIDFGNLNYISSAGLGVLMGMLQEIRQIEGDLKLVNMCPKMRTLFDMLGFSRMIYIYDKIDDALNAFVQEAN